MPSELLIPFYFSYAALWILVILHSLILLGVVRIVYQLQQAAAHSSGLGLTSGQPVPKFSVVALSGATINSADFVGRVTALLFISPNCQSCTATLHDMEYLSYKAQGNVIAICRAGREDCVRLAESYKLNIPMVADENEHISRLFGISSVPTAILINKDNRIQSYGNPVRDREMEEMMQRVPEAELQKVG